MNDCYKKEPLNIINQIPVFSLVDSYVENYDRISSDHLSHFNLTGHNPFMSEDYWREIESSTEILVKKYTGAHNKTILDVGVGMGRLLENLPDLNRFGMDISMGYLKHAKEKGIEVCMSRIEDMPYKNEYFDVICSTDVLEHVFDLNLAITNILSTLKDNGILIIRVPYREDLSNYLREDFPYDLVHLRNFDENNLHLLFEKIFNVQVIESSLSGFQGGKLKYGASFKYYRGVVNLTLALLKKINKNIYLYAAKIMRDPSEINVVIRKATNQTHTKKQ